MRLRKEVNGFTLIELSMVLVIIGVIISGISLGSSLVRQARLNSVISEYNRHVSATQTFKSIYGTFPGDFNRASTVWTTSACNGIAACNGNGNGLVDTYNIPQEEAMFWQHLSISGVIAEQYVAAATNVLEVAGVNVPSTAYVAVNNTTPCWEISPYDNQFILSSPHAGYTYRPDFDSVSPADGYAIDVKIDDGLIASGKIQGGTPKEARSPTVWNAAECSVSGLGLQWLASNHGPGCVFSAYYDLPR